MHSGSSWAFSPADLDPYTGCGVIGVRQTRKWLGLTLPILILVAALPAAADVAAFPDPGLHAAVQDALGLAGQPIDTRDLERLTTLLAGGRGISDLTGLEACRDLQQLYLYDNQIVDLSPLAGLQSLVVLNLSGNRVVDIATLAGLTNLASLTLHGNQITDLGALAGLPNLNTLSVGNLVRDITPVASLPQLERLKLYVRPEADLAPLAQLRHLIFLLLSTGQPMSGRVVFDPAVLASAEGLASLQLHGYDIADVEVLEDAAPNLTELSLQYVGIDDLVAFADFERLTTLTLSWLVTDPDDGELDLSRLALPVSLRILVLEGNGIEDLSGLAGLEAITSLSLPRNEITDIAPLGALENLQGLDLSFNPLTDLSPLLGLSRLRSLNLQGVPFDPSEGSDANAVLRELLDRAVDIIY